MSISWWEIRDPSEIATKTSSANIEARVAIDSKKYTNKKIPSLSFIAVHTIEIFFRIYYTPSNPFAITV